MSAVNDFSEGCLEPIQLLNANETNMNFHRSSRTFPVALASISLEANQTRHLILSFLWTSLLYLSPVLDKMTGSLVINLSDGD